MPRYQDLAIALSKEVPAANLTGAYGKSRDFEITAGGTLIYSKRETGAFPNINAVSLSHVDVSVCSVPWYPCGGCPLEG